VQAGGPAWLTITIAAISLIGIVVTAVVGPVIVERFKSGRPNFVPPTPMVIAQQASDAVTLIQSAIADLQARVGRLEVLQMRESHDQRG
jgi:tellurite resistance protein TehA-like permease